MIIKTELQQLSDELSAIEGRIIAAIEAGGGIVPPPPPPIDPPPPPPPPIPTDVNVYPLQMPPGILAGETIDLGIGPDTLTLFVSGLGWVDTNTFVVLEQPGNRVLAGPLTVTARNGMDGGQYFHLHGSWGPAPKDFKIVSGNSGFGLEGLWGNAFSYNFVPLYYSGPTMDARGGPEHFNSTSFWDNTGIPFTLSTELVAVPAPPPPPPPPPPPLPETIISGATNGAGPMADGTLQALVNAASNLLILPAGVFIGTAAVPGSMTIRGAGMGLTTITALGIRPTYDKGVFVPLVSGVTLEDMTITGASIAAGLGGNAAAVRGEPNVHFTLRRVEVTGNQNGIMTAGGGNVTTDACYFHDNGNGNPGQGATHEAYLGLGGDYVSSGSRFVCGLLATHATKSRGSSTRITDDELVGNIDAGQNGGAVLDVPNGGLVALLRTSLEIRSEPAGNHVFFLYGQNNADNGVGPVTLDVNLNGNGVAGIIESLIPGVDLTISGTYTGLPPDLRGWGTVTNTLVAA